MLKRFFLSDSETVERIRQNDRSILGELFIANQAPVTRFVKGNGGTRDDAQDMLQEAIIVLWQNVNKGGFSLSAKIGTYLFSIARNKWLAELRRRKKQAGRLDDSMTIEAGDDVLLDIIDSEEQQRINDALNKLAQICRDILLFFYFERRSMKQIASLTGLANPDVAKAKKYQCIKALQKIMLK